MSDSGIIQPSQAKRVDWRVFVYLLAASVVGQIAVIPYAFTLLNVRARPLPVPLPAAVAIQIVWGTVLSAVMILLGLLMAGRLGLGTPWLKAWLDGRFDRRRFASLAILWALLGALGGAVVFVLDRYAFAIFVEPITPFQQTPPVWQRLPISLYGGINEEIYLRLFLMTLVLWLWSKIRKHPTPTSLQMWTAIIAVSIVFGLGHLPMTAQFMPITPIVIVRAIVLNGILGILYGWLYWRKGLESAVLAHFSTDIILHVLLPLLA
jgi:membrane protease YdiL (CAAX protease family)